MLQSNPPLLPTVLGWLQSFRSALVKNTWFIRIARWGYIAKGLLYMLVGFLALQAASGSVNGKLGMQNALSNLSQAPFGPIILSIVGVGLVCYVIWCLARALTDIDQHGSDWKGLLFRARYVVSGIIFANLAFDVVELIIDWSSRVNDLTDDWTRALFQWQIGRVLVSLAGIVVLISAGYQWYIAWTARFLKNLDTHEISAASRRWINIIGRIGYAARGVVFGILGGFLVFAVYRYTVEQIDDGIGDALLWLAEQTVGPWLLGLVACGLMCYGLYLLAESRFRTIEPQPHV